MHSVTSPVPRAHRPGFFAGLRTFIEGIAFIVATPPVWGFALVPAAIALTLFLALGIAGVVWVTYAMQEVGRNNGTLALLGAWLIGGVVGMVTLVGAALVACSLAQPLAGFALEKIARKQALLMGRKLWVSPRGLTPVLRAFRVTVAGLLFALPSIAALTLAGLIFPPWTVLTFPLEAIVAAIALSWNFLDYPFSLRGAGVRQRLVWMGRHLFAVIGFGLAAAVVMLIPAVGLFVLPMGVAGATRLLAESDRARRQARTGA